MGARNYYVSAIDGPKRYLIAGPYSTHEEALARVDAVREFACDMDGRACFMAWGTAGSLERWDTVLGRY